MNLGVSMPTTAKTQLIYHNDGCIGLYSLPYLFVSHGVNSNKYIYSLLE